MAIRRQWLLLVEVTKPRRKFYELRNRRIFQYIEITSCPCLLSQLDLGDRIPEALYVVIAEVLCFAYRLSGKHKDFMDDL